jgi:hypothetical protein
MIGSLKITKHNNLNHKIQQSHWLEKNIFMPTHNLILLNIENDLLQPFPLVL